MQLISLQHSVPPDSYTQEEMWNILNQSIIVDQLRTSSLELAKRVLCGNSGIRKRHFALSADNESFALDATQLNQAFEREAPKLAQSALDKALNAADIKAEALDALVVCTCTGYLCPGVTSYVAERMNMRPNIYLQDIVGLGCGAAIPSLRSVDGLLKANPNWTVAFIAVEVCSAAFYIDNDPGVIISACLFGDGASASIWRGRDAQGTGLMVDRFDTLHIPEQREELRFTSDQGKLRNILKKSVPKTAADAVSILYERAEIEKNYAIALHSGGRDVINEIHERMPHFDLSVTEQVLASYGNMSSPSVMVSFEKLLEQNPEQKKFWLSSFGAGFACHSCRIQV